MRTGRPKDPNKKNTSIQLVMSDREIYLLEKLSKKLGVTKSKIIVECVNLVIDENEHLLEQKEEEGEEEKEEKEKLLKLTY